MSLDIGDSGLTAKFQSRDSKAARYCARGKVDAKDVGAVDSNPASENSGALAGMPSVALGEPQGGNRLFAERDRGLIETSSAPPRWKSGVREVTGSPSPSPMIDPAPASPPSSRQAP